MKQKVLQFIQNSFSFEKSGYKSTLSGPVTLYATCYALLTKMYLGEESPPSSATVQFILNCQNPVTGYFIGPELVDWSPETDSKHSREHLLMHLSCAVLPTCQQFGIQPRYPMRFAHPFCNGDYLANWLNQRDFSDAWLEGNNLLFVGQLLIYLREVEHIKGAEQSLKIWFDWLDRHIDPRTGLWGTNGFCDTFAAMCGGYHQLLVYYHEKHPIIYYRELIESVLVLQQYDGGFSSTGGGGGACEDVDAVDILVNMYKRYDYKRPTIRSALRKCLKHLLSLQQSDGGFPYRKGCIFSHMGIPATTASEGCSDMFSTWFRVHTIALISEILTDKSLLNGSRFNFSKALSMGWHQPWGLAQHPISTSDRIRELPGCVTIYLRGNYKRAKRVIKRLSK